ncbi:hypothetical protein [Duganella sp. LjRoot269]|uniref:hypothetical protein n=1 Tax=Duganella sp. LjRoot269 TaxID=3342305 RepID=UPI003ECC75C6
MISINAGSVPRKKPEHPMNMTPQQIAAKPAGEDQITRAQEIAGASPVLQERLSTFLASGPTRGEMADFLSSLRSTAAEDLLKERIEAICRVAGIEQPSGSDRLMAMQIGLIQEQNTILQNGIARTLNQMRVDAKADNSDSLFTALLGGTLIGVALAR